MKRADENRDALSRLERLFPAQVASWVAMLFAAGVVVATHRHHWHTGLLLWGIAIAVLGVIQFESVFVLGRRLLKPNTEQLEKLRRQASIRRKITIPGLVAAGLAIGTISAALDLAWIDLALSVFAVLVWIVSYSAIPRLARRAEAARTTTAGQ